MKFLEEVAQRAILDEEQCWQAVMTRNRQANGTFVFAVRSTGIYCRPSCPARRPRREQVSFFRLLQDAQAAGFRPCRRCYPDQDGISETQQNLVEQICRYIEANLDASLRLADLGQQFHLSPYHLQRTFKRIKGVSPRQYAETWRLQHFKARLLEGENVSSALYDAGYQSSSSVYKRTPLQLGMTPGTYRMGGKGMQISYTIAASALGYVLIAATERGVAATRFGDSEQALEDDLTREYPAAELRRDEEGLQPWVALLLRTLQGDVSSQSIPLDIQGTAFQWMVWQALRAIPEGETRSYSEVAQAIGQPTAARAVANACASNPVAVLIPCHRVVRSNGHLGGYRWGVERKQQLLSIESTARPNQQKHA